MGIFMNSLITTVLKTDNSNKTSIGKSPQIFLEKYFEKNTKIEDKEE